MATAVRIKGDEDNRFANWLSWPEPPGITLEEVGLVADQVLGQG